MVVSIITLALSAPLLISMYRAKVAAAVLNDIELGEETERSIYYYLAWTVVHTASSRSSGSHLVVRYSFMPSLDGTRTFPTCGQPHPGISGAAFLRYDAATSRSLRYPPGPPLVFVEMPWWLGGQAKSFRSST